MTSACSNDTPYSCFRGYQANRVTVVTHLQSGYSRNRFSLFLMLFVFPPFSRGSFLSVFSSCDAMGQLHYAFRISTGPLTTLLYNSWKAEKPVDSCDNSRKASNNELLNQRQCCGCWLRSLLIKGLMVPFNFYNYSAHRMIRYSSQLFHNEQVANYLLQADRYNLGSTIIPSLLNMSTCTSAAAAVVSSSALFLGKGQSNPRATVINMCVCMCICVFQLSVSQFYFQSIL